MNENEIMGEVILDAKANLNDQEVLNHTKRLKLKLIDVLAPDEIMPTDAKDVNTLLNVFDSLDRTALANIKQQSVDDNNQAQREAIAIIAQMQKQTRGKDPFMTDVGEKRIVTIEETLVTDEFSPGELSTEFRDLTYDEFVEDFEDNN